jgi:regulator of replication initiation timing
MTISSPEDKKKIFGAIREISNSLTRIEAERDLIKDIVKDVSDNFQIPRKTVKKIATTYHKQNMTQVEQEHEEFVELYDDVTKVSP